MQSKKLISCYLFIIFVLAGSVVSAQTRPSAETSENIFGHWSYVLDSLSRNKGADFDVFTRFSSLSVDSLRGNFLRKIADGEVTLQNVKSYEDTLAIKLNKLYGRYGQIKTEFPSSVEEFTKEQKPAFLSTPCDSACNNIDFESGTLSGWNAYYAFNASTVAGTYINNITGGPAGAVTEAANDGLTSIFPYYNPTVGPNPSPDYQVSITSGTRGDAIVPSIPVVSPFGGHYSVMLGDSSQVNYGVAILSQTFEVTESNANFTYQYAVLLANPSHAYYEQPFFRIFFINQSGDTIPYCGQYNVVSGHGTQQFDSITYYDAQVNETFPVYYKNWTTVNVPLKKYIGQCITVVFESGDCSQGGHFGYAYVDASCSPLKVLSSSDFFCGQDSITLTGPAGEGAYTWTGPPKGIISNPASRSIDVDSSGTYSLIITPVTGASCNDTLSVTLGKKPGPPPNPNFSADTVCLGMPTIFANKSEPIAGASFYWDFYNIGDYQDSTINPQWTYNLPGIYSVKLHESQNGCGMDTVINVEVDSLIANSFTDKSVCPRDTVFFYNTSKGAISYKWNFGDASSGKQNTSTSPNPHHVYSTSGTYTVTLIDKTHQCADTTTQVVTILPDGNTTLSGPQSICSGGSAQLSANGSTNYLWSTGATTATITVSPKTTGYYYCIMKNSDGCVDTGFCGVVVYPDPVLTACCDTFLTPGHSAQLSAEGMGTFLWSPPEGLSCNTCSNPVASPAYTTTYTVTLTNDSGCSSSQLITIDVSCGEVFVPDIFSPNGDHNNILYVRSPCIADMVFMVFDRWGNRVFESRNQDIGWDGHHNGTTMDAGTYVWRLTATLRDGTKIERKGNVTLIR